MLRRKIYALVHTYAHKKLGLNQFLSSGVIWHPVGSQDIIKRAQVKITEMEREKETA